MLVTLRDALGALEELVDEIETEPEAAEQLMGELLPAVYAKLNFAWHTRQTGPKAIDTTDHDALVSWPEEMGF
jgi:hypothetical protein